jgi:hypothetical protein
LQGGVYKWYRGKILTDYAIAAEDRLSFLCIGDGIQYPSWPGINPCLLTAGANPEHKTLLQEGMEEHLAKAKLIRTAICDGVIVKEG